MIVYNNNTTKDNIYSAVMHHSRDIARVHSVHTMNTEQRQIAADLWTKPTGLSHKPDYRQIVNHIHHCHFSAWKLIPV